MRRNITVGLVLVVLFFVLFVVRTSEFYYYNQHTGLSMLAWLHETIFNPQFWVLMVFAFGIGYWFSWIVRR